MKNINHLLKLAEEFYAFAADLTNKERQRRWRERHPEKEHEKSIEQAKRIRLKKDQGSLDGIVIRFQQQIAELKSETKRSITKSLARLDHLPGEQELAAMINNHPKVIKFVNDQSVLYNFKDQMKNLVRLSRTERFDELKPTIIHLVGEGLELITKYLAEYPTIVRSIKLIVAYLQEWLNDPNMIGDNQSYDVA